MKIDPAATGSRATQCNRVGSLRFESGHNLSARVVAHNRSQLLQREQQLEVAFAAAFSNTGTDVIALSKTSRFCIKCSPLREGAVVFSVYKITQGYACRFCHA